MFNSIFADLCCPVTQTISKNTEIQIKWQDYRCLALIHYHVGDVLEGLEPEYNNTWIRTDYICACCSPHTTNHKHGFTFIKTEDQQRHDVFSRVENSRICEILTEAEFAPRGLTTFVEDW